MQPPAETRLWAESLGAKCKSADAERSRERLVAALGLFRERATELAGEIARDHPEFTVHDERHFDALWDLADRIAGPSVTLTPTEAFVFGGATLIHDLGMASAAYVGEQTSVRDDPRWADRVAWVLRNDLGRSPSDEEIASPSDEVMQAATAELLRELHAERAEKLATATWQGEGDESFALLEDKELRKAYGPTIGSIAHSHWWAVSKLDDRFADPLGAPAGFPSEWTVRPLIVACLLRLADASHLDASRAPSFLRTLRKLSPEAAAHWDFQARISQPYAKEDRFVFTGGPFEVDKAEEWWLAADTLQAVDREFRAVDSLLVDRKSSGATDGRFAIRGVAGADDLSRLAEILTTEGWTPADARVRVSNVVRLVERLGGKELYGERPHVPLRELLQNASDAVRARRKVEDRDEGWGEITVRLGSADAEGARWLVVEDTGVGMSPQVLSDHLLDFGQSFWESPRVLSELPNLLAKGFEPTGRFGIGFFSVFMWGDDVTVTSRRHDAAKDDTTMLAFSNGLSKRPLLRAANPDEQMVDPGSRVAVLLDDRVLWRLGVDSETSVVPALAALCAWLAPALDVTLKVSCEGEEATAVEANDWLQIPVPELGDRITRSPLRLYDRPPREETDKSEAEETEDEAEEVPEEVEEESSWPPLESHVRQITMADGNVVGRAFLDPSGERPRGAVTIGGLRSTMLSYVTGVLLGDPTTASRNVGIPVVSAEALRSWATEQATLLAPKATGANALAAAQAVYTCGGATGPLPIAESSDGSLTLDAVAPWVEKRERIVAIFGTTHAFMEGDHKGITLPGDWIVAPTGAVNVLHSDSSASFFEYLDEDWPASLLRGDPELFGQLGLFGVVLRIVEQEWGGDVESMGGNFEKVEIARRDGSPIFGNTVLLERRTG